uniref:non-specific serine/threonine protein kinase n=1 Tax=Sinohyriopsis cumingii TaxID=165450 RepID=A0A6G6C403_SINCU|nr:interleukin-1 receptor-associated kinase 4 [Sinohyriopsis cumingii]
MTGAKEVTEDTFIRHLPYSAVRYLSLLLDVDNNWKKMVNHIPKKIDSPHFEARYSQLQVRLFEDKGKKPDGSPTRAIIDDWATQNAQVRHLMQALLDASLIEAADYLSMKILKQGRAPRPCLQDGEHLPPVGMPVPAWHDPHKEKNDTEDDITEIKRALHQENKHEPKEGQEHSLDSDQCHGESEIPANSGNMETLFNRIPSYESGGNPSQSLFVGQERPFIHSMESFENQETLLQRAVKVHEADRDTSEPCESIDELFLLMPDGPTQCVPYSCLAAITDNFNSDCISKGGRVIGRGGFGTVYLGLFRNGYKVAVKSLHEVKDVNAEKQFITELQALSKYRHDNIVFLLGYSVNGPNKCLVYEYMCNGSLEDRLLRKNNTPSLPGKLRLSIASGTGHGIHYLNSLGIIHRDIKSANVLLDENFTPKVGDFATVRTGPMGCGTTAVQTTLVIGTSAYLAPEAYHFDISTKLDSYSFGVVLLEIITGLPALDQDRDEKDLKSYVEEHEEDLTSLVDKSVNDWSEDTVEALYKIATRCLEHKKKIRVNVGDILEDLDALI